MPDITLKVNFVFVLFSKEICHAARMLTPEPIISGFKIPGLAKLGPLEENGVTTGASFTPITVPLYNSVAVGVDVEFMYALIACLAGKLTCCRKNMSVSYSTISTSLIYHENHRSTVCPFVSSFNATTYLT